MNLDNIFWTMNKTADKQGYLYHGYYHLYDCCCSVEIREMQYSFYSRFKFPVVFAYWLFHEGIYHTVGVPKDCTICITILRRINLKQNKNSILIDVTQTQCSRKPMLAPDWADIHKVHPNLLGPYCPCCL